ncbi:PopZ family protein [Rhizobium sp. SL86]|uniref:PopZ family protein n=1 Tax=Rhizobium sp. SL86 TaxID=2995148 RepID=UPI002274DC96|nr:DUF2497 domain-containing protein [Rhizobium sp. SL86]MCY1668502.1 DUF2497 domain-containing protein [Rhizobium sp. SL86]
MAQPSVAREPSMEEILASIRRIIESNDPITESMGASASSEVEFEDEEDAFELTDEVDNPFLSQVPANDPGSPMTSEAPSLRPTHEPAQVQRVETPEPEEKTLSLADVAARVRAAAGRVPEPVAQRPAAPSSGPNPAVPQMPSAAAPRQRVVAVDAPVQPRASELSPVLRELHNMRADTPSDNRRAEPVLSAGEAQRMSGAESAQMHLSEMRAPEPRVPETRMSETGMSETLPILHVAETAEEPMTLPVKIEEAASLISQEAGEQVARSFKQLADVFNGIERQSVEDMAREMLKPMLREWLDDNLPTLVERMVREEIERVARGPRR